MHGLISNDQAQDVHIEKTVDGQTASAVIHAGSFDGSWLSETDLHFTFALTGDVIDEKVTARNIGHEDEPIAIGAHPYFTIPSQERAQAQIHIPAETMAVITSYQEERPTGALKPVGGTPTTIGLRMGSRSTIARSTTTSLTCSGLTAWWT